MLKLRGLKQDVAKRSEPKMQEGILVFKRSYNLVPWFVSSLQEEGLCTILPLEEQKNCANQSLNAIHGQNNFSSWRGLYYYSPLVSIKSAPSLHTQKKYDKYSFLIHNIYFLLSLHIFLNIDLRCIFFHVYCYYHLRLIIITFNVNEFN